MTPISMDLRVRIYQARESGETTAEVAERFEVSPAFVRRLLQRHREGGSLAPKSGRRGPKPALAEHHDRIRTLNAEHPDLSPAEVRDRLQLTTSVVTVWRAFVALGLTFKKSRSTPKSENARTSRRPGNSGTSRSKIERHSD